MFFNPILAILWYLKKCNIYRTNSHPIPSLPSLPFLLCSRLSAARLAYSANRSSAETAEQRDGRKRRSISPEAAHPTHGARAAQRGWQAGPGPGGAQRRAPGSRSVGIDGSTLPVSWQQPVLYSCNILPCVCSSPVLLTCLHNANIHFHMPAF